MKSNTTSLKIQNLLFGYSSPLFEKAISFSLSQPALISIIGPNGSGKSTFIKTLAGIIPPINGKILINNFNIHNISPKLRSQLVSIVLSQLPKNLNLTVKQIINCPDINSKKIAIQYTKIQHLLTKNFSSLSDGQKQLVMITKNICKNTPVILMDEPEAHLDPLNAQNIFLIAKKLSSNKIIFFVTHQIHLASKYSDFIWILSDKYFNLFKINDPELNLALNKTFPNLELLNTFSR